MSHTPLRKLDRLQKVAILVSTLDHRVADALLDRLTENQAALVRAQAIDLADIPEDERDIVVQEFLKAGGFEAAALPESALDDSGVELDASLAEKLKSPPTYEPQRISPPQEDTPPFHRLHEATTDALAKHLRHENPQVIAVVLAHLPPHQAANVVKQFEPPDQADLLRRVAELDSADPDILRDVERHLNSLLSDDLRAAENRAAGLTAVASILDASGGNRGHLITNLVHHDQRLAALLQGTTEIQPLPQTSHRKPTQSRAASAMNKPARSRKKAKAARSLREKKPTPFAKPVDDNKSVEPVRLTFDELSRLDDDQLAKVFAEADAQLTLLSLAGAAPDFVARLLSKLPAPEASQLRRRMEQLGPTRLSDIEHAQRQIALIAGKLAAGGELHIPEIKRFAMAA